MKRNIFFAVLAMVFLSCKDQGTNQPQGSISRAFEIHLQTWFFNTPVVVSLDGSQIFSNTVSTGSILAFAAIIPVQTIQGMHKLTVTVANSVSKDSIFMVSDTLYAGVNYNATNGNITYNLQRSGFPYR